MFHIQGNRTSPILGSSFIAFPPPEATVSETLPGRSPAPPSPPHIPTYVISPPYFVV